MKALAFTMDEILAETLKELSNEVGFSLTHIDNKISDINTILHIYNIKPHVLVIDDEYFHPETVTIIKSIRQFSRNAYIIFVTKNESVELGRELSEDRIHSYHIKPVDSEYLRQSLNSIKKNLSKLFKM